MTATLGDPRWRWLALLPLASLAGWLLQRWHAPLPWMIGPLLCLVLANALQARVVMPPAARYAGQWLAGSALGLFFTAPVLLQLVRMSGWIAVAVTLSLALSLLCAQVLRRVGRTDPVTAFFASAVGGAAEMANQAERHGARVDQVAAAQVARVLFVVLSIPFVFRWLDLHGTDRYSAAVATLNLPGLVVLLAAALLAGALFSRCTIPNAWLFGPLLLSGVLTASGNTLSGVPPALVNAGQLLIGASLGARFAPEFFRDARYLLGVAASGMLLLAGCALIGLLLALLSGSSVATAILATAPGGIAEMGLTAKVLQFGVPVVTAFHAARLTVVVLSSGPLYRWLVRGRTAD